MELDGQYLCDYCGAEYERKRKNQRYCKAAHGHLFWAAATELGQLIFGAARPGYWPAGMHMEGLGEGYRGVTRSDGGSKRLSNYRRKWHI